MNKRAFMSGSFTAFLKEKKNLKLIIPLLLGIALMLLPLIFGAGDTSEEKGESSLAEYRSGLEAELSELCSQVSGAGKCIVKVSFSEGERFEYKNGNLVGSVPPKVAGVTVLSAGGDRIGVKADITELISALLGVSKNRICVLPLDY